MLPIAELRAGSAPAELRFAGVRPAEPGSAAGEIADLILAVGLLPEVRAVEVALIGGLTAAGLNPGVAISVAILFRVVTYWLQIPLGWVAMRYLQRRGEL